MIKKIIIILSLVVFVFGSYEKGEKIFKQKCSSCHSDYIPPKKIKDNFFNQNNKLLNLKAPTINMLVWAILDGPKKIGQEGDDFRKDEIEEYLIQALFEPSIQNSICDTKILKFYKPKKTMKGKISEEEISLIADFILSYKQKRAKLTGYNKISLDSIKNPNIIITKAKKHNKPILIKATSKNCYFCKKMDKEVFEDKDVQQFIGKNFIFVEVDVDRFLLPFGLQQHYKKITPSFFVIDKNKQLINSISGSWNKQDFINFLKESL
jgi:thioredoxin-related protein